MLACILSFLHLNLASFLVKRSYQVQDHNMPFLEQRPGHYSHNVSPTFCSVVYKMY